MSVHTRLAGLCVRVCRYLGGYQRVDRTDVTLDPLTLGGVGDTSNGE